MFLLSKSNLNLSKFYYFPDLEFDLVYAFNPNFQVFLNNKLPTLGIYQAFQVVTDSHSFKFILPGCSFLEKFGSFITFSPNLSVSPRIFPPLLGSQIDSVTLEVLKLIFNEQYSKMFADPISSISQSSSFLESDVSDSSSFFPAIYKLFPNPSYLFSSIFLNSSSDLFSPDTFIGFSKTLILEALSSYETL